MPGGPDAVAALTGPGDGDAADLVPVDEAALAS